MASSHRLSAIARRSWLVFAVAAACAAWSDRAAAAPIYVSTVVTGCNAPNTTQSSSAPFASLDCNASGVTAQAGALGRPGFVGAFAFADLFLSSPSATTVSGYAQGSSTMQDSFVVAATDASGAPVTSGLLTIAIGVEASASASGIAGSLGSVIWAFEVGLFSRLGRVLATSTAPDAEFADSIVFQVPWTSGAPVNIRFSAAAEAAVAAGAAGYYSGIGVFDHSMEWLGIRSVTDAAGNPVASFTALSPDGFDYSVAVPEPGSLALVALGLAGLAKRVRAARGRTARKGNTAATA